MIRYACLLSLLVTAFSAVGAQDSAFPTNEQMRHFKRMADPQLSPDGKHVLLVISDSTADGGKTHVWLASTDGEEARQLTYSPESDKRGEHYPQWMPDGKSILFLAKRGEHTLLYRLPMDGGEALAFEIKTDPVVDESRLPDALPVKEKKEPEKAAEALPLDISSYAVAPDGKRIAFIAEDPETPGEKAQKEAKADAEWVNHGLHGSRLYLFDVAGKKLTPAGVGPDVKEVKWSPDGSRLVVLADGMNGASDLGPAMSGYMVTVSDTLTVTKINGMPTTVETADWSRDGGSLLVLAQARRDAPPGYADLYRMKPEDAGSRLDLSDGFDGSLRHSDPIELADGSVLLLVEYGFHGKAVIFPASSKPGSPKAVELKASDVASVTTNEARNGFVFETSGGGVPPALYFTADLGKAPTLVKTPPLTPEHVKGIAPREFSWKSDGFTIHGALYLPSESKAKKVPLIVEVHGGPLGAFSDAHEPWIDFLMGQGWAVLRVNPRGSSGYGAAFAAANKNDLGGGDYRDIMAGVDAVVEREPIDADRMALIGYSYGGEMAGFVEGRTDRFKAIVSGAPVIDQESEYGTESDSWYDRWYFGEPWEHPEDAWRQSPLAAAGKAKTPFLLLQGQSDTTDPLGQSQEMYRALRQMGVKVSLVTYPRDNHGPLAMAMFGYPVPEPWHGFDARRRVVEFMNEAFGKR